MVDDTGGNNAHDTCQGDSGGPAYLELPNQKRLLLAGVTSRGGVSPHSSTRVAKRQLRVNRFIA